LNKRKKKFSFDNYDHESKLNDLKIVIFGFNVANEFYEIFSMLLIF